MRTARHGGFADESARGSSCRGASAQHVETSALTQSIAKASPPRYCWLGFCGVRSISLARQKGSSRLRDELKAEPEGCWLALYVQYCSDLASTRRESCWLVSYWPLVNALRRKTAAASVLRSYFGYDYRH